MVLNVIYSKGKIETTGAKDRYGTRGRKWGRDGKLCVNPQAGNQTIASSLPLT